MTEHDIDPAVDHNIDDLVKVVASSLLERNIFHIYVNGVPYALFDPYDLIKLGKQKDKLLPYYQHFTLNEKAGNDTVLEGLLSGVYKGKHANG